MSKTRERVEAGQPVVSLNRGTKVFNTCSTFYFCQANRKHIVSELRQLRELDKRMVLPNAEDLDQITWLGHRESIGGINSTLGDPWPNVYSGPSPCGLRQMFAHGQKVQARLEFCSSVALLGF